MIWGLPYGLISAYDTAIGQEFLPSTLPKIGPLIPNWLSLTWFILGIVAFIFVTFEGAYRISRKGLKANIKVTPITGRRANYERNELTSWAELEIMNINPKLELTNVSVKILELVNVFEKTDEKGNGIGKYFLHEPVGRWNPSSVYWSGRTGESSQFERPIHPNEKEYATIAFHHKNGPDLGTLNTLTHPTILESKIVLEVSSPNSNAWQGAYYIGYHPPSTDKFDFVEWDMWCKNHEVIEIPIPDTGDSLI